MGLFEHFPYTNFHELNLDWLLRTAKQLDARMDVVENKLINLDPTDIDIEQQIFDAVADIPARANGNILADIWHAVGTVLQGMCYIGNNRVVYYVSSTSGNNGSLVCVDLSGTPSEVWRRDSATLYHGNSITYYNNTLYIVANSDRSVSPAVSSNIIFTIDLTNPVSGTIGSMTLPGVSKIISMCYDDGFFYVYPDAGSDVILVYDTDFTRVGTITASGYADESWQGFCCAAEGVLYTPTYFEPGVYGCDLEGNCVINKRLEPVLNGYRITGELQAITYDWDNDRFLAAARTSNCGEYGYNIGEIFELGLYRAAPEGRYDPDMSSVNKQDFETITINVDGHSLKPISRAGDYKTVLDAVTACKAAGVYANIILPATFAGLDFRLSDFNCSINGRGCAIYRLVAAGCRLIITDFDADANGPGWTIDGTPYYAPIILYNSDATLNLIDYAADVDNAFYAFYSDVTIMDLTVGDQDVTGHCTRYGGSISDPWGQLPQADIDAPQFRGFAIPFHGLTWGATYANQCFKNYSRAHFTAIAEIGDHVYQFPVYYVDGDLAGTYFDGTDTWFVTFDITNNTTVSLTRHRRAADLTDTTTGSFGLMCNL